MKSNIVIIAAVISLFSFEAFSDQYVSGYTRKDGTYVQGYVRSSPNNTVTDNYSYSGNTNPHTGSTGTNSYIHDRTSPSYEGPDSHGNVGHQDTGSYRPYDNQWGSR